jgi:hypothetical protein
MAHLWVVEPAVQEGMRRYARLIAGVLTAGDVKPASGSGEATRVELGVVFASSLISGRPQPLPPVGGGRVVDRLGHDRPLYKPLLAYAMAMAAGKAQLTVGDAAPAGYGAADAAAGDRVAAAAWGALAELAMGRSLDAGPLAVMQTIVAAQQPSGGFLATRSSDSLEALWFHELAILHAVASFAVQRGQAWMRPAVARAVRYHIEETQPDHATNQPWGLTAFLLEPDGWPLADSMLHAAGVHGAVEGRGSHGLTLMLLADALYCLRQLGITE